MELFRGVNVDWLRLKWYFLGFSLIFSVAGLISMGMHCAHHRQPGAAGRGLQRRHAGAGAVSADSGHEPDSPGHGRGGHQGCQHRHPGLSIEPAATRCSSACRSSTTRAALDAGRQQIVGRAAGALRQPVSPCATCRWWAPRWASSWRSRPCWPRSTPWLGCWSTFGSASS